jgi:hypothetical protein
MAAFDSYVVSTSEIDDIEQAVEEITSQLPLNDLKASTLGIIACHYEFTLTGAVEAICEALPFTVVGTITSAQATKGVFGSLELVLTVLSSDTVTFSAALSEPLSVDSDAAIDAAIDATYAQAAAAGGMDCDLNATRSNANGSDANTTINPDLIFIHAPFMPTNSADDYLARINMISNNTPLFGTLAVDDTADFKYCYLIYDGKTYNDRMALTLIKGVAPRFYCANVSPNQIIGNSVVVTKSAGQLLIGVNDRPVFDYLNDLGLVKAAKQSYAMSSLPFMLDYGDGTPLISRVLVTMIPDGSVILTGSAPEGTQISISAFDKDEVLSTTALAIDDALLDVKSKPAPSFMLVYSCISRSMALGVERFIELEQVQSQVGDTLPLMMAYSGGEFCPLGSKDSVMTNRFHNNTLVVCTF